MSNSYTSSQLQNSIGKVILDVQKQGYVEITHRSLDDMILMTKTQFEKFTKAHEFVGAANKKEADQ